MTPEQIESRWKILIRGYKKYLEKKGKSGGGGAAYYKWAQELSEILGHRHDIFPVYISGNKCTQKVSVMDQAEQNDNLEEGTEKNVKSMKTKKGKQRLMLCHT